MGIALELEAYQAAKRQRPSPPDVMSGFLEELQALFLSLCFPLSQTYFRGKFSLCETCIN